ncbi:hypothetical protein C1I89_05390 [Achromobacter pulmonis]|uniref:Uncharacterized protein n=1 Tax=Achromobacter pulmonis TaxID=1389932 RepID=A0A2N8KR94_9BURK|nr:hypothetical protein [Achromobacter pulmonis]PND35963.1 hypothetical protein C1I89_05390 [Achromobacter pulmonis]
MKLVSTSFARVITACRKFLPQTTSFHHHGGRRERQPIPHSATVSPWRVYRIYARPGHLFLRNEQGKIFDFGVMKGAEPNLAYRLFVRGLSGQGFASRTQLLDDITRRLEAEEIAGELLDLPECTAGKGIDLDRGTHVDVSMKLAG